MIDKGSDSEHSAFGGAGILPVKQILEKQIFLEKCR
jgi:hypothetical protein